MNPSNSAETFFHEARKHPAGPQRDAYLAGACRGDTALRAKVDVLLAADAEAGAFLAESKVAPGERAGAQIGRYKLLEQIGEGGMGTIWMAEQREPLKRRVALKIIKFGMDTKQVIARFEAERQALALMDHANIAKVFDAGATDTGRPYFVMEYIKGIPIIEYCDQEKLDTESRLELFTSVCHAIQHAHQKGIIHRDIKPSNVLVTLHGDVPVPKVIDFGIAKATNSELTTKTLFTEHRQMVGTPAYMSPEQAEMSGLDIDTRSDIYSLGVLLYELLTGTTPFDMRELLSRGFAEMMRTIREDEPHKPSTRISTLGDTGTRTAQQRRIDPKKLSTMLRGDIDWIVMKCLEKDRTRRYETANGLAADIQRHLHDEPVTAGAPSAGYRLRKFVRRNRASVLAGAAIAAVLILGVVGTAWGLVRSLGETERANSEAERAERELARATEVKRLITEMLQSIDPETARGADTTLLRGILDQTAARLSGGEITDELITAEMHEVIGNVYARLTLLAEADRHLPLALEIRRRILGDNDLETLRSMMKLAGLRWRAGRYAEAELEARRALDGMRRALGEDHELTLRATVSLAGYRIEQGGYDEAEALLLKAREAAVRVLGEASPLAIGPLNDLAWAYQVQGRYEDAESALLKLLDACIRHLPPDDRMTRYAKFNLANVYRELTRFAEAEPLIEQVLETDRRFFGEQHPETLSDRQCLGSLRWEQGRCLEAEAILAGTLDASRRVMGPDHEITAHLTASLAGAYRCAGRFDDSERMYSDAYEGVRSALGENHLSTLLIQLEQAVGRFRRGGFAEAEPLLVDVLARFQQTLGNDHPGALFAQVRLAELYVATGRHEEADALLEETLPELSRVLGPRHLFVGNALQALARAALGLGDLERAQRRCVELLEHVSSRSAVEEPAALSLWMEAWVHSLDVPGMLEPAKALASAELACKLEEANGGGSLWIYLDTLALAQHLTGATGAAVETERRALGLVPAGHPARAECEHRLSAYEAAMGR